MPLEATVVCLDGSEFMRNGDYTPNRLDAMKDCANLLVDAKYAMNPEASVGVVASGFALGPKALCSCSPAESAINALNACSSLAIQNSTVNGFPLCATLQVAALALKHRRNKNGQARIVLFCGSPILDTSEQLIKMGKNLKKNNIAVDVISMGESEANEEKLGAFMEAVQKSNLSSLVVVPPGVLVSEAVTSSPIFQGSGEDASMVASAQAGGAGVQAASFAEYGGVDPSLDPEMAMALRASMEEERARLAAIAAASASSTEAVVAATPTQQQQSEQTDEEAMLAEAILLSMRGEEEEKAQQQQQAGAAEEEDDEAKQLALAMALSQEQGEEEDKPSATSSSQDAFLDPQYVNQLLEGLEGIDKNDPAIQALLRQQQEQQEDGPDSKKSRKNNNEDDNAKTE